MYKMFFYLLRQLHVCSFLQSENSYCMVDIYAVNLSKSQPLTRGFVENFVVRGSSAVDISGATDQKPDSELEEHSCTPTQPPPPTANTRHFSHLLAESQNYTIHTTTRTQELSINSFSKVYAGSWL